MFAGRLERTIAVAILMANLLAADAGWFTCGGAYFACMGACTSGAAAGGLMAGVMTAGVAAGGTVIYGSAACAYVCAGITGTTCAGGFFVGPLCFADGTMIDARFVNGTEQQVPVETVIPGMEVATLLASSIIYTHVVANERITGPQQFTEAEVVLEDGTTRSLMQTSSHLAVRFGSDVDNTIAPQGELVEAQHLKVGDMLTAVQNDAKGIHTSRGRVSTVRHFPLSHRNALVTNAGTVLSNKIFTTTTCEGLVNVPENLRGNATAAIETWRHIHA